MKHALTIAVFFLRCAGSTGYEVNVSGLGELRGSKCSSSNLIAFFGGIPYAQPPTGSLRWQPPRLTGPWQAGVRDASSYGPSCWQRPLEQNTPLQMSEDCLYLNVLTPVVALNSSQKLPVMLWLHGGGYEVGHAIPQGTGPQTIGDVASLVLRSDLTVVGVSINYRLAVFGFLGSSELQARSEDGSTGNFGIQDQRMAMLWVKQHISAFGGDGQDITIFGESAGGNSVLNHLVQAKSFGLYTKAIIQSGAYDAGSVPVSTVEPRYHALLNSTLCKNLDCLLGLSAEVLRNATTLATPPFCEPPGYCFNNWAPVIDGISLMDTPHAMVAQGKHNTKVPLIVGSNRDEQGSPWWAPFFPAQNMNEAMFDEWFVKSIKQRVPDADLLKVKGLYSAGVYHYPPNLGGFSIWWWMAIRVWTDQKHGFGPCGVRWLAQKLLAAGSESIFTYMLAHPLQTNFGPSIAGAAPGSVIVPHASDLPFTFGTMSALMPADEVQLALKVSSYWLSFAKTADPNAGGSPQWPKYAQESDTNLRFDVDQSWTVETAGIQTQQGLRKDVCDYWTSLGSAGQFDKSITTVV